MTMPGWDPGEEEGLTPSQVVDLGEGLRRGVTISLECDARGFVATVDGRAWSPYGILTELLEALGVLGDAPS